MHKCAKFPGIEEQRDSLCKISEKDMDLEDVNYERDMHAYTYMWNYRNTEGLRKKGVRYTEFYK